MPAWAGDWNNLTLNDFKCRYGFSSTDVSLPANASQLSSILDQKAIMRRLWFSSQHYRITRVVHSTPICWTKIPHILTNAPTNSLHTAQGYEILSDDNSGQEIFKVLKIWKYRRFDLRHASLSIFFIWRPIQFYSHNEWKPFFLEHYSMNRIFTFYVSSVSLTSTIIEVSICRSPELKRSAP